jgi:hypothetical protein
MLAADLASASADQAYSQNVQYVWSFAKQIGSLSLPPSNGYSDYGTVTAPFLKTKSDALQWVNNFYPASLQLPQQIIDDGQQITPALATLVSAAQQLQSDPNNTALHTAISNSAQSLATTVSGLLGQINTLVKNLQGFAAAIQQDVTNQQIALHRLNMDTQAMAAELNALYGRLHSLESATCPDRGAIASCQQQIQSLYQQLNAIQHLAPVLQSAAGQTSPALQGLQYLSNYWASSASSTQTTLSTLQATVTAPVNVLQLDLAAAQNGWNQILKFATNTVSQIGTVMAKAA